MKTSNKRRDHNHFSQRTRLSFQGAALKHDGRLFGGLLIKRVHLCCSVVGQLTILATELHTELHRQTRILHSQGKTIVFLRTEIYLVIPLQIIHNKDFMLFNLFHNQGSKSPPSKKKNLRQEFQFL